jgi:CubicO group peptidase (beta-lactamase class C family)
MPGQTGYVARTHTKPPEGDTTKSKTCRAHNDNDKEPKMSFRHYLLLGVVGLCACTSLRTARAQSPDPNSPRWKGVVALSEFLASKGSETLQEFVEEKVSPALRKDLGPKQLTESLEELRSGFQGAKLEGAQPQGEFAAQISFSNDQTISFQTEPKQPHRFVRIGSIRTKPSPNINGGDGGADKSSAITTLDELEKKLRTDAESEAFSGVVLIAEGGKPIFHEAYGYADKNAGTPNNKQTKFNIGSINKIFTKVAVYQLIEAGKLSLEDKIGKFLPQFPPEVANQITIQHLLEHKSGWGAYWENPIWLAQRGELRCLDDYMAFIKDIPLDFEPGARKQYSNTGYEVLGSIVEKVSGQSYYDYVREHIYLPTGMTNTDAYEHDQETPNRAVGYVGGGYAADNIGELGVKGTAAGGGFSTAVDLMRFALALEGEQLLPRKYTGRMRHSQIAGGGPGVSAFLMMNVAGNHTVVVLSNFDPQSTMQLARQIESMLARSSSQATGAKKYRIGVGFEPLESDATGIAVSFLVPGGPGERDGLKPGDVILAINDVPIDDDPIAQFDAVLIKAEPITLKVRRGAKEKIVSITPD